MLPFDRKPWAKHLARSVIVATLLAELMAILWLRRFGPLDTSEVVGLLLILVAVVPPNLHIIRRKPGDDVSAAMTNTPMPARK